jgi:hypothetical protein
MKNYTCLTALALCLGFSGSAYAGSLGGGGSPGFQMNVLDPPPGGTLLTSNIFAAPFSPCSAFMSPTGVPTAPASLPSDAACFEGINATGLFEGNPKQTWTSLTITIADPLDILGLDDATCGTLGGAGLFSASSCSENLVTDVYTLTFSGTATIAQGQSFFIAVETPGVDLATLNANTTISAVAGVTPEPASALLLATGTGLFGMLLFTERRRLSHNPLRP